jgi:acyl-CoA thioester hydrolase
MQTVTPKITNVTSYRVIYGDTDQMGVVYYANYLRWFERGRSEFLRQIGLPYSTIEQQGFNFPVVEVTCRYAQSARYDDVVRIETELTDVGRAALSFSYRILREADGCVLATGTTRHASIDNAGRVTRIPKILLDVIQTDQEGID